MPILTREEAVARAELLNVESYRIDLDFTDAAAGDSFTSTSIVRFSSRSPGASTFIQLAAQDFLEASLNGHPIDKTGLSDGRLRLTGLAADNEVRVTARLPYSRAGEGMHRFTDPVDGETYLYAQCGPANASRVFACFDQPDLKAPIRLSVTAPPDWTVWANGTLTDTAPGLSEFAATAPISTYLMTVVAGPYHTVRAEHDGIPLGLAARRSLAGALDCHADEILALTRTCFDHYHRLFDIRYPFGEYLQAFVPEFNWGAVENPGCVNFAEELLYREAVTDAELEHRAVVIAHEMAHMWFGDLVTLRWWDDIWLNEAFAEYMGWKVTAEATGFRDAWTGFALRKMWGAQADQYPSTHPVAPEQVTDAADALSNFDGISYAKGAAALRQLAVLLGEQTFLTGLRRFFTRHAYGNATLADLLDALSCESGRNLDAWAEVWLRRSRINTLAPRTDGETVTLVQTAPPGHDTLRPHALSVAVYDGPQPEAFASVTCDAAETAVSGLPVTGTGVVLVNSTDTTFAKPRFDPAGRARIPRVLPLIADPVARAVAWTTATHAVRDAEWPPLEYLDLVAAGLAAETHTGIFGYVIDFACGTVIDRYLPQSQRAEARSAVAAVCDDVLRGTGSGPSRRLAALRGQIAAATAGDTGRLAGWLAGDGLPAGLVIGTDLRWHIVTRLAVLGAITTDGIDKESSIDPSAHGIERAAQARAALPDPDAKAAAWRVIMNGSGQSARLRTAAAQGFWQPDQGRLTRPYVERYFDDLTDVAAASTPAAVHNIARAAYPRHAVDRATVTRGNAFANRDDVDVTVRRVVGDATDELHRAVRARSQS